MLHVHVARLNAAEAEIQLVGDEPFAARILGPRCPYASTVEIAYYARPMPGSPAHRQRIIVPEPSYWDPQTPYLYEGPAQVGSEVTPIRVGFRVVAFSPTGIRVNQKPFVPKGGWFDGAEGELPALREAGWNTLVCPVREDCRWLWKRADQLGFFVLGVIEEANVDVAELAQHPSCLGWLCREGVDGSTLRGKPFVGQWLEGEAPLAPWAQFAAGPVKPTDASVLWLSWQAGILGGDSGS